MRVVCKLHFEEKCFSAQHPTWYFEGHQRSVWSGSSHQDTYRLIYHLSVTHVKQIQNHIKHVIKMRLNIYRIIKNSRLKLCGCQKSRFRLKTNYSAFDLLHLSTLKCITRIYTALRTLPGPPGETFLLCVSNVTTHTQHATPS